MDGTLTEELQKQYSGSPFQSTEWIREVAKNQTPSDEDVLGTCIRFYVTKVQNPVHVEIQNQQKEPHVDILLQIKQGQGKEHRNKFEAFVKDQNSEKHHPLEKKEVSFLSEGDANWPFLPPLCLSFGYECRGVTNKE